MFETFIRSFLFGGDTNTNIENSLSRDIERFVDVKETIENGGLFYALDQDLKDIIRYIEMGNHMFHDGLIQRDQDLDLKTKMACSFFNGLSAACRGDVGMGITSNSTTCNRREYKFEDLDQLIRENVPPVRPQDLEVLNINDKQLYNVLRLYDVKCKSEGRLIDPFSMVLTSRCQFVDPIHWETELNLLEFMKLFPENKLTRVVEGLLRRTQNAILSADCNTLPVRGDLQLEKFIFNINTIDERVEKVGGRIKPPKLIDLFQRLLAKLRLDTLWMSESFEPETKQSDPHLTALYIKNQCLENENKMLREMLSTRRSC